MLSMSSLGTGIGNRESSEPQYCYFSPSGLRSYSRLPIPDSRCSLEQQQPPCGDQQNQ
jgi:hypothetical protein